MSKEQFNRQPIHGQQCDIFAVGVIAFEVLLACSPFEAQDTALSELFHSGKIRKVVDIVIPDYLPRFEQNIHFESFIQLCCSPPLLRPKHATLLLDHPFLKVFPK